MRSILMLIIWFILGFASAAYISYDFFMTEWVDSINSFVESSIDQAYSWANDLKGSAKEMIDKKSQQIMEQLNNKKEQIKSDIKESIRNYIDKKLENLF